MKNHITKLAEKYNKPSSLRVIQSKQMQDKRCCHCSKQPFLFSHSLIYTHLSNIISTKMKGKEVLWSGNYNKYENQKTQQITSKKKKGGLKTLPFIIANETFEKVAGFGLLPNMIFYLQNEYNVSLATGANIIFLWNAISNFLPIIGAFVSDSFLGRFRVITLGTITSLLGMILLWLTAIFHKVRPPHCDIDINGSIQNCVEPTKGQLTLLFTAFVLMSIGAGGIRPCSLAFGADQFDNPNDLNNPRVLQTFFNWYYASVGVSIMVAVLGIVAIQDAAGWAVGFGVPVGLMFLSIVMFLLGSPLYVKVKADKSLFTSFAQVIAAAWRKRSVAFPAVDSATWHHLKGSKLMVPTEKLRFLNKACLITNSDEDLDIDDASIDPWSLCTIRQVEELKALIKVLPLWSTGIMIGTMLSNHAFPAAQANTLDRHFIGKLHIPAASYSIFAVVTLTIWVALYDRGIVRLLSKFTNKPRGLSHVQRMGIGLVISCLSTVVAGLVEHKRRGVAIGQGFADMPRAVIGMSANWLVPQYCLLGLAEGFNAIAQIEFYYSQFPKTMSSIGVALLSLGFAVGNLVGSLIVTTLEHVTKNGGGVSWVANNLNKGRYDYYYWLLSILSVVNFLYFLVCSWQFGSCEDKNIWDEGEVEEEEEMSASMTSPIVHGSA